MTASDPRERVEVDVRWREDADPDGRETLRRDRQVCLADVALAADLDDVVAEIEAVEWRRVPGVSALTAAVFAEHVDRARRELREADS